MSDDSPDRPGTFTGEGYAIPISGLLAFLFALLAGASTYPALTGDSLGLLALPVIFGLASLLFFQLRRRYVEAKTA